MEDVIIRTRDKNPRLAHAKLLDELKVALRRANPGCDLRETITAVAAHLQRLTILLAVDEKLALANQPVRAAEFVHHIKQAQDLLRRKRRAGLLPVTEGRIGDPDILRHAHRHEALVEGYLWNFIKREDFREQIRLRYVLYIILIIVLAQ
ncbi:hypothetical protein SDC9_113970 [bioreactor metagenome]|uniref:Uncharacterized protein n=1 Tax=bioreactor metagenome TaxID=1076179 RepID=A0A645BZB4_9ZZZZ